MDRRDLFKTACVAGASALVGRNLAAQGRERVGGGGEAMGVLVDTTLCLGCRACERACAEAKGLPLPEDEVDLFEERTTSPDRLTVVNAYQTERGRVTVKRQCMHCLQPACGAACLTAAMKKTPGGPVIWREDKCMGCRFCMISCPFDVPRFEYDSANPRIRKCDMCFERLQEGEEPACVASCPTGALKFGPRTELLDEAQQRVYSQPDRYVHHIYGEHEAGGTSFLYLAPVPFEQLGFPTHLDTTPYPTYTREFLYAVPVVLTVLPPFLLAVAKARRGEPADESGERWTE
ncbi:MAG: 4Fe-4S dicluster domain-containing protein [Gemmatimonadetes bacterium]|nr:4Fe-4S dicluster domain-containing protein [Gemmatimonadota bacterium]